MAFYEMHIFRSFSTENWIFGHFGPKKWRKWRKWRIFLCEIWFYKGKILEIFLTFFNVSDTVIFGPFFPIFSYPKKCVKTSFCPCSLNPAFSDKKSAQNQHQTVTLSFKSLSERPKWTNIRGAWPFSNYRSDVPKPKKSTVFC